MKYTNNFNLPQSLCNAVERNEYVRGSSDASVTELCKPPQQAVLERQHSNEIVVDVSDQIFALMGKAVHHVLEVSDTELTEQRMYYSFPSGLKLGGQFDRFVLKDGVLQDYKVASVWSYIFKSFDDWIKQLNAYAFLLGENGYRVERIQVVAIYRDWSATMAERDPDRYPKQQVMMLDFPLQPHEDTYDVLNRNIETLIKCLDNQDTPRDCTADEMWEQPTKYALMKEGRKSAVKVSDNQQELIDYAVGKGFCKDATVSDDLKQNFRIEVRPGVRKRCEKYCNAAPWCSQYQEYQLAKQE